MLAVMLHHYHSLMDLMRSYVSLMVLYLVLLMMVMLRSVHVVNHPMIYQQNVLTLIQLVMRLDQDYVVAYDHEHAINQSILVSELIE